MSISLLLAVVAAAPAPADNAGFPSMAAAAHSLATEVQTGTLLFSKGDCLAIKAYTQSPYTHVAAVVVRKGRPFVFDSTSGVGVRCQTLKNYLKSQSPDEIYVLDPATKFSSQRTQQFDDYLQSKLGTPYAVAHHLTGRRANGVHCAEYVTDALMACRLIRAKQPPRVSPASLVQGVTQAELYSPVRTVRLQPAEPPTPQGSNWCDQLWLDTKLCTVSCCTQMKRWVFCR